MIGDVSIPNFDQTINDLTHFYLAITVSGMGSVLASTLPEKPSKISRRKILLGLGSATIGWAASAIGANVLGANTMNENQQQGALRRILARVEGIISDFHPENSSTFFRNAVMARKMLTIAETYKSPPKIAFQVENGHSGIEDFLQLGPEGTKAIILAHPKSFLKNWVETNGGIEDFCSSRLIKLAPNFKAINGKIEDKIAKDIKSRRVVDFKLKEGLEKILQY